VAYWDTHESSEWRRSNKIQKWFFKLGHATFATFDDVLEEYKANPSPYFHNAVAQAARNVKQSAWVCALEQRLMNEVGVQYDPLTDQSQQKRRQGCIRDLISIQRGTVLRPFERALSKEVRGKRLMYQDVMIPPAASPFHPQHQLQFAGYPPLLPNPVHPQPPPTWQRTVIQPFSELSDDSSDDASKQQYSVQSGTDSCRSSAYATKGKLAAVTCLFVFSY
jgi:hypothetical protein